MKGLVYCLIKCQRLFVLLVLVFSSTALQAATCTSRATGNWNVASVWDCGRAPLSTDDAVIGGGYTVTLNTSPSVLSLTVNNGSLQHTGTANRTLTVSNGLAVNANGSIASSGSGTFTLAATSVNNYNTLAADILNVTGNVVTTVSLNVPTITIGGTLSNNGTLTASTALSVAGNLTTTGTLTAGTVSLSGDLSHTGSGAFSVTTLVFQRAGTQIADFYGSNARVTNLTVNAGTTLSSPNYWTLNFWGALTNNGSVSLPNATLVANGTSAQSIGGTSPVTLGDLQMNNAAGLALNVNLTVNDFLVLTSGVITAPSATLYLSKLCTQGSVTGGSTGSHVDGAVQLTFPNYVAVCTFPVGSAGRYAPVTVAYASQGGITGGRITGRTTSGDHPDTTALSSGVDPAKSVNRYWTLTPEAGTNIGTFDAVFQFCNAAGCGGTDIDAAANPANFVVAQKVAAWTSLTPTVPSATSRRVNGLTSFGDFAIGEVAVPAARLAKTVSTPSASINDVVTFTVTATNAFPQALPAFDVTDILPTGGTLQASAASSGTINVVGQTITWSVPGLPVGGSAQLTLAVKVTQRGVYTNTATTPNATPASASLTVLPGAITHFRMDEPAGGWTGASNEVVDSGGTGLHGRRVTTSGTPPASPVVPVPTIKSQYPAVVGDFCNAGNFGGNAVVRVPSNPKFDYTTQLSASTWIYPTAYPSGASDLYSILSNDQNYEFHLTPSGKLYWWWQAATLTSAATIPLNQWTHVAITFNSTAAGRRQIIYINGVPDTATNNWQGTLSPNPCDFHIGGDVATGSCALRSERNFRGMIDEAKLYDYELAAAEVRADMLLGRTCPGVAPLDHVRIEHDGTASVCTPETVTIKACADASCSTLYAGSVTTMLSPAGWTGGDTVTFSGGVTSKQLGRATAGNVTLGSSATSPTPVTTTRCFKGGTESCILNFAAASCTFDAVEVGANPKTRLFTKLSDTAFNLDILALTTAGAINTSYTGTVAVDLVDASASACPTGTGLTTASNLTFVAGNAGRKTQTFTLANRAAPNVRVRMREGSSAPACSTDNFTIRPQEFSAVLSSASADSTGVSASAAPTFATGAGFTLTANTGKPGYNGQPKANRNLLEWVKVDDGAGGQIGGPPTGGRGAPGTGALDGSTPGNLTFATAATATTGNGASGSFTYDEAGYFRFNKYGVYDDTFTAASGDAANGDCIADTTNDKIFSNTLSSGKYGCNFGNTAVTSHFGRFIPDHFDTAVSQACLAGNFTYSGQPIPLTITARNLGGGVAQNYSDAFSRQVALTARDVDDTADNPGSGAFANSVVAAGSFVGGVANPAPVYNFNNPQIVPTQVRIRASDGEVSSLVTEGVANLRSGRIRLQNANGSELLPLPVPLQIQFWNSAAGWQANAADTCTVIQAANFAFAFPAGAGNNLAACETRMQVAGIAPNYTATLSAPGAGNNGWADLTLNLGAVAAGNQCTVVGGAGGAATTANAPWLQFNWAGAVGNPTARATFGVYRSGPVIHRREAYR